MATQSPGTAQTVGTDVMRKPSEWRGTLLEGTDALIATNNFGEPLFIQVDETVAPLFAPAAMTASRLANEFKTLCIDTGYDQAKLAQAAPQSGFSLQKRTLTVQPRKNGTSFTAAIWHAPEARVQIWSSDLSGLNGRQSLSRWRNGATSGPFKDSRTLAPACNVTVMTTSFDGPEPFVAAMSQILGRQPAKSVIKDQWADGHWLVGSPDGNETRIFYSMVNLDKNEQLLHVAIATRPAKKDK